MQRLPRTIAGIGYRSWTLEPKREIVAERLGPELASSEVARKFARTDTGSDESG